MAGGFGGRGAPLHARTRVGAPATAPPTPAGAPATTATVEDACPARHCWVTTPVDGGAARPGLLLEWRRGAAGWEGRVVYAAEVRSGRWAAVEEWLAADLVAAVARPTRQGLPTAT